MAAVTPLQQGSFTVANRGVPPDGGVQWEEWESSASTQGYVPGASPAVYADQFLTVMPRPTARHRAFYVNAAALDRFRFDGFSGLSGGVFTDADTARGTVPRALCFAWQAETASDMALLLPVSGASSANEVQIVSAGAVNGWIHVFYCGG